MYLFFLMMTYDNQNMDNLLKHMSSKGVKIIIIAVFIGLFLHLPLKIL